MPGRHKERRRSSEDVVSPPQDTHRLRLRSRSPGNDGGEWHRGGLRAWREEMSAGADDKHEDMPAKLSHRRGSRMEERDRARYPVGLEDEPTERMPPDERSLEGLRIARSRRSVRTALENELEEDGGMLLPPLRPARRVPRDDVLMDGDGICEQGAAATLIERTSALDDDLVDTSQVTQEHRQRHKRRRHEGERRRRRADEIADAMQHSFLPHCEVDNALQSRSTVEHQNSTTTLTEIPVKETKVKRRKRKHESEMMGQPQFSLTRQEQAQEDLVIIRREEPRDRRRRRYSDDIAFQDAQTGVANSKDKKRKDKQKQLQYQGEETMMQHGREATVPSNDMLSYQSDQLLDNTTGQRESRALRKEVESLQVGDEALEHKRSKRMKGGHHHAEKAKKEKEKKRAKRDDDKELKLSPTLVADEQQPMLNDDTNMPRSTMPLGPGMSGHQMFQPHMLGRPPVFSHMMSSLMRPMFGMMPNGLMMMRPGMGHPASHPAINASIMPGMDPRGNMAMNLPGHASATGSADDRDGLPRKSKSSKEPVAISDAAATRVLASHSCSSSSGFSSSSSSSSSQAEQNVTASAGENVETDLGPPAAGSPETISKVQECMNSPIPLDAQVDDESTAFTASAGEVNNGPGQSVPLAAPPGIESPPLFGVTASEGEPAVVVGAEELRDAQGALSLLPSLQKPRNAGWHEVLQSRSIEDLRLELDMAISKEAVSIATQTDGDPTSVPEKCIDYWFAGFSFPMSAPGPIGSPKAVHAQEAEGGASAPSSPMASHEVDVVQGQEGTCRPERRIRRRPLGSRSRSPSNLVEPTATQAPVGSERKRSSSTSSHGSSSSSSASLGRRQRATSSEGEGPNAALAAPLAVVTGAVQASASIPPSLRAVPDYSDVM